MRTSELFESCQGEGKYVGHPALFIRLSGCSRSCPFCDTKYHRFGREMTIENIVKKINDSRKDTIIWTGGEPMLQQSEIYKIIEQTKGKNHQLETNGDILPLQSEVFQYIAFSPKERHVANKISVYCLQLNEDKYDIKIVTDLKLNKDLIEFATMLMPLSTGNDVVDKKIQQRIWNYCVKHNIKYTPRIHRDIWGIRKKI